MKRTMLMFSSLIAILSFFVLPASSAMAASKGELQRHSVQAHQRTYIVKNIQQFFQQHVPLSSCGGDGCDGGFALDYGGTCISQHVELDAKPVQLGTDHYGTLSIWQGGASCTAAFWTAFQNITGSDKYVYSLFLHQTVSDAEVIGGTYGGCAALPAGQYAITEMLGASLAGQGFFGRSQTSDQSNCGTIGLTNTDTIIFA